MKRRVTGFENMVFIMEKFGDYDIYKFVNQPAFHIQNLTNYYMARTEYANKNGERSS